MPTGVFKRTKEHRNNISKALKGRENTWQHKEKIKCICPCGKVFWVNPGIIRQKRGKYHDRKCYYKYRINFPVWELSHKRKGKDHWAYKGNNASYSAYHLRVQSIRGKAKICGKCNSTKFVEWANISKKYEDVYDYKQLCRKCHNAFDNIANRVAEIKKAKYKNEN